MIAAIIRWSVANRFLVAICTVFIIALGAWSASNTPVDALPDLSDTQVIIRTSWPGQAPEIVENQITYPLSTQMMSVPGVKVVRGYSFFGDSYVYILFDDDTDPYWARSRVLEYLNQVQARLPANAKPSLGPDATGVGWIYQYALVDKSGQHDLAQLRALQDWFLKYELKAVPNVSEVATVGGMVKQYQVVLDPARLRAYNLPASNVVEAIRQANNETGGAVVELAEAEYMIRAPGYLSSLDDFRQIPVLMGTDGTPVLLGDVATLQLGPEMRRGIAELNGEGEVVGGIIVMRSGKNALETIHAVKAKLDSLKGSLPPGVEIVETYDRSGLIERAMENLLFKLGEEMLVVALVCAVFLGSLRSSLVAVATLPIGILLAFILMRWQGINANILSLSGIAIAIGAMVDAAIVMIENAHRRLEQWEHAHDGQPPDSARRWQIVTDAAIEVGPAVFFSLLIITLSFIPVFALEAQEGRLFHPLAFTKTYAMGASAILAVTLVPPLMGWLISGRIPAEQRNPVNRGLIRLYKPQIRAVLAAPKTTLVVAVLAVLVSIVPLSKLGSEFLPPLDEGDLLYMPSALPGLSAGKAAEILQQSNKLIASVPEVKSVMGKMGRAETATDPAPLEMVETIIQFKPKDQWRPGMTQEKLIEELDARVQLPGLANIWIPPIRNRLDMLATGIKSPLGIKVSGSSLAEIEKVTSQIEQVVRDIPGVSSSLAERVTGGRYIDIDVKRTEAARYGMSVADVQSVVSGLIGGENIGETVEGLQRFPINVRYPRELRGSLDDLRSLLVVTPQGGQVPLSELAEVRVADGPPMLRSENSRLSGWVYVDIRGRDISSVVEDARRLVAEQVQLSPGISIAWSGQFEFLERAKAKLAVVIPFTLLIIFVLLYMTFRRFDEAVLIMATLPLALVGGFWYVWLLGHSLSVASWVGFIALAGVAAEFGVVMLIYLKHAVEDLQAELTRSGRSMGVNELKHAIFDGAALRVRPKAMTVMTILAGLAPIMWTQGTGSEIMQRIAAPMLGGMVTAPLLSMLVVPAAYFLLRRRELLKTGSVS